MQKVFSRCGLNRECLGGFFSGKLNSSVSGLPAVEVVIERDIVEFIDYDKLESRTDNNNDSTPMEEIEDEIGPGKTASEADTLGGQSDMTGKDRRQNDMVDAETAEIRCDKVDAIVDENNNVRGVVSLNENSDHVRDVASLNENSDQAVMTNAYQNEADTCMARTGDKLRDTNNNIGVNGVQQRGLTEQNIMADEIPYDTRNEALENNPVSLQKKAILPAPSGLKETVHVNTTFSAVMPSDLEHRQLIQVTELGHEKTKSLHMQKTKAQISCVYSHQCQ